MVQDGSSSRTGLRKSVEPCAISIEDNFCNVWNHQGFSWPDLRQVGQNQGLGFPLSFRNPYWAGGEHMTGSVDLWTLWRSKKLLNPRNVEKRFQILTEKWPLRLLRILKKGSPLRKLRCKPQNLDPGACGSGTWSCGHVPMWPWGWTTDFFQQISTAHVNKYDTLWLWLTVCELENPLMLLIGKASISMGHLYHGYVKEGRYR